MEKIRNKINKKIKKKIKNEQITNDENKSIGKFV